MSESLPWSEQPLSQLANYFNGRAFKPNEWSKEGLAIIRIQQINNPTQITDYYNGSDIEDRHRIRNGDLLFSWSATLKALIWKNGDGILNQHIFKVVEHENVNRKFLQLILDFNMDRLAESSHGSTMKHIRKGVLDDFVVQVPPPKEQQKIAEILTSVDEVIENTLSQINKLGDLKKATMNELFTKGIGHTEFKDTEIGRIPKNWSVTKVKEIAEVVRGASPRPKGDPRYYGGNIPRLMVSDVTRDGKYVYPQTDSLTEEGEKLSRPMKKGDLTIVCSGTVGVPSILGIDACIHDGFLGLVTVSSKFHIEFLYYFFVPLQAKFDSSATHGGIFTNLTTEILKEFLLAMPPIEEQLEIIDIVRSIDEVIDNKKKKFNQFHALKKSLMQDLLTGKVRVTVN